MNQIGTVSETLQAIRQTQAAVGCLCVGPLGRN